MCLWFCCHYFVVVSEQFNSIAVCALFIICVQFGVLKCNQEPIILIKTFAAFTFADNNLLGFDSTIDHVPEGPTHFIITVHLVNDNKHLRKFHMTKIISSFGAKPL